MPDALLDNLSTQDPRSGPHGFAIAAGVVVNNIDALGEGRVQVKVASRPSLEPWARLPSLGGAGGRGFMWVPAINDEVLVAFAEDDAATAYILGGLWSTMNKPPLPDAVETLAKRVIKTGLTEALGHKMEFDDVEQSITITTSTEQKITMDPTTIKLTNLAGTVSITLDNAEQAVSIQAVNKIDLSALQISMTATTIDMTGSKISITSAGPCQVQGLPIQLN